MRRALALLYGTACYAVFFATFLYLIGFLANLVVPRSVDSGPSIPTGAAVAVDLALVGLFGLQHSVMARQSFKRRWTRLVPQPIERSTYVLVSSMVLGLLYWQWRPIPAVIWDLSGTAAGAALQVLFWAGWGLILVATFVIDHFDLFGLRQVADFARGRDHVEPRFRVALFYRFVRHPLYVGWLTVFWAAPVMSTGHLLFAAGLSGYILLAIPLEERDLIAVHGRAYEDYREQVPALIPRPGRSFAPRSEEGARSA